MSDHFTITVDDHNGITHFNLHKFVKKAFFYLCLFIFSSILISVSTILYLNENVEKSTLKKEKIEKEYSELNKKFMDMINEMEFKEEKLAQKKMEMYELASSLNAIENLIGIADDKNLTLEDKLSLTQIKTEHKMAIFQFIPNGSPIKYNGITSKYGYRIHPVLRRKEFHHGTDMKAKMNTPVYATADGVVEWSGKHKKSGYGNLVILTHNYGFKTYYGHLNKLVLKGKKFVKKGDLIAYTGNTGRSSGPHLHYEIKYFYNTVNPYWFIKWTMNNYDEIFVKIKKIPWKGLIEITKDIKIQNPTKVVALSYKEERAKHK